MSSQAFQDSDEFHLCKATWSFGHHMISPCYLLDSVGLVETSHTVAKVQGCAWRPFKAGQVHGIHATGSLLIELLGCLTCLYSWVVDPRTLQATCPPVCHCMSLHVSASHLSPCMLPVPLWEIPTPLYTKCTQSGQGASIHGTTERASAHAGTLKAMEQFIRPVLKAIGTLLIGPSVKVMESCFPQLPRHLGEEARLPPFTLQAETRF